MHLVVSIKVIQFQGGKYSILAYYSVIHIKAYYSVTTSNHSVTTMKLYSDYSEMYGYWNGRLNCSAVFLTDGWD